MTLHPALQIHWEVQLLTESDMNGITKMKKNDS